MLPLHLTCASPHFADIAPLAYRWPLAPPTYVARAQVRMHAIANWGVAGSSTADAFVSWMSAVTVMYNYFGYTWFPRVAALWSRYG